MRLHVPLPLHDNEVPQRRCLPNLESEHEHRLIVSSEELPVQHVVDMLPVLDLVQEAEPCPALGVQYHDPRVVLSGIHRFEKSLARNAQLGKLEVAYRIWLHVIPHSNARHALLGHTDKNRDESAASVLSLQLGSMFCSGFTRLAVHSCNELPDLALCMIKARVQTVPTCYEGMHCCPRGHGKSKGDGRGTKSNVPSFGKP